MAQNKVLVTGATGFLGSRICQQLLQKTQLHVTGTTCSLGWKSEKLRTAIELSQRQPESERLTLIESDLIKDEECFYKAVRDLKPDYVIHTAFPFIEEV